MVAREVVEATARSEQTGAMLSRFGIEIPVGRMPDGLIAEATGGRIATEAFMKKHSAPPHKQQASTSAAPVNGGRRGLMLSGAGFQALPHAVLDGKRRAPHEMMDLHPREAARSRPSRQRHNRRRPVSEDRLDPAQTDPRNQEVDRIILRAEKVLQAYDYDISAAQRNPPQKNGQPASAESEAADE